MNHVGPGENYGYIIFSLFLLSSKTTEKKRYLPVLKFLLRKTLFKCYMKKNPSFLSRMLFFIPFFTNFYIFSRLLAFFLVTKNKIKKSNDSTTTYALLPLANFCSNSTFEHNITKKIRTEKKIHKKS